MPKHNFLFSAPLAFLAISLLSVPALSRETAIEKLESFEAAIVTVKGQKVILPTEGDRSETFDPSTGRISVMEKTGAGIVIDPSGMITTNTHIIFGSNLIKVVLPEGGEFPAQVLFVSSQYDFSIIKIDAGHSLTPIQWADSDMLTLGQKIVTIGHSPLLDRTLSGGVVAGLATRTSEEGTVTSEMLQLNINHYAGDSGGPVFDDQGRFIALLNAKRLTLDRAALAVPANKIHFAYLNLVSPQEKK